MKTDSFEMVVQAKLSVIYAKKPVLHFFFAKLHYIALQK